MATVTEKSLAEFKRIYKKEYGKDIGDAEARDAAQRLLDVFKLLLDVDKKERARQLKLKESPKGYHLTDGTYSCCVCGKQVSGEGSWYDKHGIKCLLCQRAVEQRKIPVSVCTNKDSWYATWELAYYYKLKSPTIRKLVRNGTLKARIVPHENGSPYFSVFLVKDNLGVLQPKPKPKIVHVDERTITVESPGLTLGITSQNLPHP
ncbi:MAG: Uncharacterized protein G01um101438_340 [Parcubacteria group bacterium Gr01-1014_38]|nr:MAG: Uncharacterized protein G01um101438_340 [Parcubacteria group bacterium Gr01-1014_38]